MPSQSYSYRGSGGSGGRDRDTRSDKGFAIRRTGSSSANSSPLPSSNTSPVLTSPTGLPATSMIVGGSDGFHHPTQIQRSRPYFTEEQIEAARPKEPGFESKDVNMRLSACTWILQVGGMLQLPIRTMTTAMILFHRLRVFNPRSDYPFADGAGAALFVACKIEDTLKKSREILAAGHALKLGNAEPINSDNPLLEEPARRCLALERMILESSSFDFRNRHSQSFLIKFCRFLKLSKGFTRLAWDISIDAYRTLAPLKAPPHVQALAAIDLAARLLGSNEHRRISYRHFEATQDEVISVVNEILDLYTHHRTHTTIGERYDYTPESFINIRIAINQNEAAHLQPSTSKTNGHRANGKDHSNNGTLLNGLSFPKYANLSEKDKQALGESMRFMLDGERERKEKATMLYIDETASRGLHSSLGSPIVSNITVGGNGRRRS